jgi:hypothetical protein
VGAIAVALVVALAVVSAGAEEVEDLRALRDEIRAEREALAKDRAELDEQRRRVDQAIARLESREAAAVEAGTLPGVSEEGPRAQLEIYGFAQVDGIYDIYRVDPAWAATLRPSKIPVSCPDEGGDPGCGRDGETILSVRQTRLGFRGLLPTAIGELHTKFEFDLFGVGADEGQTTFRLRHAWGEIGSFGGGQTWSLFMDPDVFPNTIDYWGPVGMVFLRNPQIRWTPLRREDLSLAVAVENPGAAIDAGKVGQIDPTFADFEGWNLMPDLTGQLRYQGDWGHVQLAGIVRRVGYEIRVFDGDGPDGYEWGYGGNLSGIFRLFENDQLLWQITGGRGYANYMNDGGSDLAPDRPPPGAQAETVPLLGWLVYYNRQWNERWTSSIGFSEHRQFARGGQTDDAFELGQYGSVNVLFHPIRQFFVGPEFVWGRRKNKDGEDGQDSRIQLSLHFDFSATVFADR